MKLTRDDGNRIVLSGPPGGRGTVALLLVVGTAFLAGAWLFASARSGSASSVPIALHVIPVFCAIIAGIALAAGIGTAIARDKLILDKVTNQGRWTRTLLGKALAKPIDFELRFARHVQIERFVESEPNAPQGGTGGWTRKSRARLLISKPRRAILLSEVEQQNEPKIRATAQRVAEFLELPLETNSETPTESPNPTPRDENNRTTPQPPPKKPK